MEKINIFWFRRDLRLNDNIGLHYVLQDGKAVLPIFIFDKKILDKLADKDDARVNFLHDRITEISKQLQKYGSSLHVFYGNPREVFEKLITEYQIDGVYTNRDYEPYAKERDSEIDAFLKIKNVGFYTFKDQVIFEKSEILTDAGDFYKVFTPFKRKWIQAFEESNISSLGLPKPQAPFFQTEPFEVPSLAQMGFSPSSISIPSAVVDESIIAQYDQTRDYPAKKGTTRMGIHLRFGTISVRELALKAYKLNETYLSELIWREFYMMILYHNPQVVNNAFKPQYDQIPWRDSEEDFHKWCEGKTGYPIVDAGMRELNQTGYMHNRVRMVVASFLTKHLLIDWRWGEAYFAKKLLDFELASNNGGWQWAAGTGTDAQPYFRVFNPSSQTDKFDKELKYIKKWIPEYGTSKYPKPMVEHKFARQRAIDTYKEALA
ncbi:cryptochrome/photolyase family protein [Peijinzhouia sedimentorum]